MLSKQRCKLLALTLLSLFAFSCKKDKKTVDNKPVLTGGKGGAFAVAIFPTYNGVGAHSRIFFKYAADTRPADTNQYDEKFNTMVEPGYGPHAHFNALTTGTYYVYILSGNKSADTVIKISESTTKTQDIYKAIK